MKEIIFTILFLGMIASMSWFLFGKDNFSKNDSVARVSDVNISDTVIKADKNTVMEKAQANDITSTDEKKFQFPLSRATERVSKKPFGIFITPKNSPIQPEKFSGYHTGVDFEIFPEEIDADVQVTAICAGKLSLKKMATGYGGVVVQSCNLAKKPISVVYGHLKLNSIKAALGDDIAVGEPLGVLGEAYGVENGQERKHLHLGVHKGLEINILGYVSSETDLSGWLDPLSVIFE
ncbi:MAG: M23 family metallopeptidase [Candidatus Moraniibacteriota bacterium]